MNNIRPSTGTIYVKIIRDCIEMLLDTNEENHEKTMKIFSSQEFKQLVISYHETYSDVAILGVIALYNNVGFTDDAELINRLFDLILDKTTEGKYVKLVIDLQERDNLRNFWLI